MIARSTTPPVDTDAIAAAVALCRPAAIFDPHDVRTIEAGAAAIEAKGGPATEGERRVIAFAERVKLYEPTPNPTPRTPQRFHDALAEAEATWRPLQDATDAALDALAKAQAQATLRPTPANLAALREAELHYTDCYSASRPAASRVNRARNSLEAARRGAAIRGDYEPRPAA